MKKMHPIGLRRYGANLFLSAIVSLSVLSVVAKPTLVVVPNSYTTTDGNSSATYPFSQSSMHYQQVFASSQFTNGGGTITQISFRPEGSLAGHSPMFPAKMTSAMITLGVTTNAPGQLSATFADNFSGPGTVVYGGDSGEPLNLSTSYTGKSGGPNACDMRVYLTTPYNYDTNDGNLLMDVVFENSNTTNPPTLDGVSVTSSPLTSRLWGTPSSATTGSTDSGSYKGLVTQFTFGNFAIPASSHVAWLIFTANVTGIAGVDSSVAKHFFNNPNTLIAGDPTSNPIPNGYTNATPLANYNSFAQFQSDLNNNAIKSLYNGNVVMYDNENWSKTPTGEQKSAAAYETLFANLAHARGYVYLTAPSPDLTGYPSEATPPAKTRYDIFLASTNCFPAFSAAAPSEVFDNQAQKLEDDPTGYETWEWFTSSAAALAINANPACVMFAGITTTPDPAGTTPTTGQLEHAVTNTCSIFDPSSGYISGYWFNIPDGNYSLAEGALYLLMNNDGL